MRKSKNDPYGFRSNLRFIIRAQWSYSKPFVFASLVGTPMDAVNSLVAVYLPKVVMDCIERHATAGELLTKVGLMAIVYVAARFLRQYLDNYCIFHRLIAEFGCWQPKLYEKAIDMDYQHFLFHRTRVLREKARDALQGNGPDMFLSLVMKLFSALFGFTAFTSIIVRCSAWFIPALVAGYALSAFCWSLQQKHLDDRKDARSAALLRVRYATFRSKDFSEAKDIRVYGIQGILEEKTKQNMAQLVAFDRKTQSGRLYNFLLEDVLKFVVSLGAYAYLIYLKLNRAMSIGDFILYFGAITGFGEWLSQLVDNYSTVKESNHFVSDYRSFLDLPDTMRKTGGVPVPTGGDVPCRIEFDHVTFRYEEAEKATIDDFSLTIEPGERVAIVGDNGAGKSTLVKLLCGLLLPQSGHIRVWGKDSRDFNRDEYYSLFATVFQTINVLPASVAKNIALCEEDRIDRRRLETCMRLANIYDKVQSLPDKENTLMVREIHENGVSFSGGELQRLLLARALYKSGAPILILDEPTAALDPIAENDLYRQYSSFAQGKTSLFISHRLSSTRFCDRIVLLEDGGVAEVGSHDELMEKDGKYAALFRLQSRYYEEATE